LLIGAALRRGAASERRRLGARALVALARARVVLTDESVPEPNALREHAASIGRRDLLQDVRSRLQDLVLDESASARLRDRRATLNTDVNDERALALITRRSADPVLAVAGLRRAMHEAFARAREHAQAAGQAEGTRLGTAETLRREAGHLDARLDVGGRLRAVRDDPRHGGAVPRRVRRPDTARVLSAMGRPLSVLRRRPDRVGLVVLAGGSSPDARPGSPSARSAVWPTASVLRAAVRRAERSGAPRLAVCAPGQGA